MESIYNDRIDEYIDLPYAFYEGEFVPFIMSKLRQSSVPDLKRIFAFIEELFINGNDRLINLIGVAVIESIFFEKDYHEYEKLILDLCGEKPLASFSECVS